MKYSENESCIFFMFVLQDRHKFVLNLVNWLTEKIMICCFISRSCSSGIMKCYISGSIYKTAIFWNSNCYFFKLKLLHLWEDLKLFYWKCCISWGIYKFATFSINYIKLKLFYQLLQSQFTVGNVLVSLDCLNLLRIFNFLDIF